MDATLLHVCMQTEGAPSSTGRQVGERWACECGENFVYREGYNRAGRRSLEWWSVPAIPRPRGFVRGLLFGPRKG